MNAYGCDGMTSADCERAMGFGPDANEVDANEVERRLEERAEDEISRCDRPFAEWLADEGEHAHAIASAAVFWPTRDSMGWLTREEAKEQRALNLAEAVERMRADYIAYRVGTFTQDERAEVEAQFADERSAA